MLDIVKFLQKPILLLFLLCFQNLLSGISQISIKENLENQISIVSKAFSGTPREMCIDSNGRVWIAANEGLYMFDGYNFKLFNHHLFGNTYLIKIIHMVLLDNNTMILKLGESGLMVQYNINTGKGKDMNLSVLPNSNLKNNQYHILHYSNKRCWVGYKHMGLGFIDEKYKVRIIANEKTVKGMSDRVKWISDGPPGYLILNTPKGLLLYNISQNTVESLIENTFFNGASIYNKNGFILSAEKYKLNIFDIKSNLQQFHNFNVEKFTIFNFANDSKGNTYFAFLSDLYRIDKNKNLEKLDWQNGFYNNPILYILVDKFDNLWLVSSKGGLQRYRMSPEIPYPPLLSFSISAIDVNGNYLFENKLIQNNLDLKEFENSITFYFGLCNTVALNVEFRYRLVGHSHKWTSTRNTFVEFKNLPFGKYTVEVECKTTNGKWIAVKNPISFRINVPWYKRWYAIVSLIFTISLISILSYRYFKNKKIFLKKKQEEEIETRAMHETDKLKNQFFDTITHELKTPLTLIQLPIEDLLSKEHNEADTKLLKSIKQNSLRLQKLINQILEFSRTQNVNEVEITDILSIQDFIQDLVIPIEEYAITENVVFSYTVINETEKFISNFQLIFSILENLLSNAIKYNTEKGSVNLNIELDEDTLRIIVQDSGIGISAAEQTKIFNRFYQVGKKQLSLNGTGIGLSIVKEAVEKLGGTLDLQSNTNEGSVFSVSIPVIIHKQDSEKNKENLPSILIVEDNLELCGYLDNHLQEHFKIYFAHNGKEGLFAAQEYMPSIIITDIMMPIMGGFEMIEKLKNNEITSHIPIFVLSAKSSQESKNTGYRLGAEDYLAKPYNKNELVLKLTNRVKQLNALWKEIQTEEFLDSINPVIQKPLKQEKILLEKLTEIVIRNIEDSHFDPEKFCKEAGMSRTQLHNKLKTITSQSTTEFINRIRIDKSKDFLKQTDKNMTEVAYSVGYSSLSYYSRKFTEIVGVSPTDYRKSNNQNE